MTDTTRRSPVAWILGCSTNDGNYRAAIPDLTDDELRYCLSNERRKTGRVQLEREAKKRGLEMRTVELVTVPVYSVPWYQDKPVAAGGGYE